MSPITISIASTTLLSPSVKLTINNSSPSCTEVVGVSFVKGEVPRDNFIITNKDSGRKAAYVEPELQIEPQYVRIDSGASKETVIPLEKFYSLEKGENQVMYFTEIGFRECDDYSNIGSEYVKSNKINIKV